MCCCLMPCLQGGDEVLEPGAVPDARHARRAVTPLAQQPQQLGREPEPYPPRDTQ